MHAATFTCIASYVKEILSLDELSCESTTITRRATGQ